jgi:hypothetical protein
MFSTPIAKRNSPLVINARNLRPGYSDFVIRKKQCEGGAGTVKAPLPADAPIILKCPIVR